MAKESSVVSATPSASRTSATPRVSTITRRRACGCMSSTAGQQIGSLATLLGDAVIEETREFRPRRTHRLNPETGQSNAHMQFAFAAHRAVVDVDTELGLLKVVELATAQDVGRAINPIAV